MPQYPSSGTQGVSRYPLYGNLGLTAKTPAGGDRGLQTGPAVSLPKK